MSDADETDDNLAAGVAPESMSDSLPGEGAGPPPDGTFAPDGGTVDLTGMDHDALVAEIARMTQQRDELREVVQHTQADFENYRKRVLKQQADAAERAAQALVEQLLAILDACEGAIRHSATEVEPIYAALLGTLEKAGMERIDPLGEAFDPNRHEAVMHEPADEGHDEPLVSDVMRPGYAWKGRVIRPAMVKVRG